MLRLPKNKKISPSVYQKCIEGGPHFVCLILEVLRAHLLDNKIDVFCVNNEKPKKEKVQFCSQGGGVHPPGASLKSKSKRYKNATRNSIVLFHKLDQLFKVRARQQAR